MPQVSRKKLHKDVEKRVFSLFWNAITQCKDASVAASFFSDLLTETEQIMLAKRYTVACLLLRGKSPTEVKAMLSVSFSTVRSVASWLKNAKPKTQTILKRYLRDEHWSQFIDHMEELLDLLPPRYRSDWRQAGKDKWERAKSRNVREALR